MSFFFGNLTAVGLQARCVLVAYAVHHRARFASPTDVLLGVTVPPSVSSTTHEPNDKKHHGKRGFVNPWPSFQHSELTAVGAVFYRYLTGKANIPVVVPPTVTVMKPVFLASRETPNLRATWLGHACYFVEFPNGLRVLFDPVFEERCSPFQWLGPKRYTKAPCQVVDIPHIDAVVISHSHYDHLSYPTVKEIAEKHPACHFFAPLGNKAWFEGCGIKSMTEMDWWQQKEITLSPSKTPTEVHDLGSAFKPADIKARISCLPCQHGSGRGLLDQWKSLWSSWSIEAGGKNVYFAGDTGYRTVPNLPDDIDDHDPKYDLPVCPAFKQVGKLRGPFDLGLIPIGAYKPRWILSSMHADPYDAVSIFKDTKCKKALGMHWGTWVLTEEEVMEPPLKLKEALKANNLPETGVFDICFVGESKEF